MDQTGRVVRHDQGGDTVSEGQAYALLLAVALRDRARFDLVWSWTRDNIQRPDRLFSWHWDSGVKDQNSAADADLDMARALVLAGRAFDDDALMRDGIEVGRQILEQETIVRDGERVLLAGSWAGKTPPVTVNPSYVSPVATQLLHRASGDDRWKQLERDSRALVRDLSADQAPPDWAVVEADGSVRPDPSRPTTGWDAIRIPIRHAESCVAADREIAASLAGRLEDAKSRTAVSWMAQAASLAAAGDATEAEEAMAKATELREKHSSYYGDAWEALARFMLLDDRLGGCPPEVEG